MQPSRIISSDRPNVEDSSTANKENDTIAENDDGNYGLLQNNDSEYDTEPQENYNRRYNIFSRENVLGNNDSGNNIEQLLTANKQDKLLDQSNVPLPTELLQNANNASQIKDDGDITNQLNQLFSQNMTNEDQSPKNQFANEEEPMFQDTEMLPLNRRQIDSIDQDTTPEVENNKKKKKAKKSGGGLLDTIKNNKTKFAFGGGLLFLGLGAGLAIIGTFTGILPIAFVGSFFWATGWGLFGGAAISKAIGFFKGINAKLSENSLGKAKSNNLEQDIMEKKKEKGLKKKKKMNSVEKKQMKELQKQLKKTSNHNLDEYQNIPHDSGKNALDPDSNTGGIKNVLPSKDKPSNLVEKTNSLDKLTNKELAGLLILQMTNFATDAKKFSVMDSNSKSVPLTMLAKQSQNTISIVKKGEFENDGFEASNIHNCYLANRFSRALNNLNSNPHSTDNIKINEEMLDNSKEEIGKEIREILKKQQGPLTLTQVCKIIGLNGLQDINYTGQNVSKGTHSDPNIAKILQERLQMQQQSQSSMGSLPMTRKNITQDRNISHNPNEVKDKIISSSVKHNRYNSPTSTWTNNEDKRSLQNKTVSPNR